MALPWETTPEGLNVNSRRCETSGVCALLRRQPRMGLNVERHLYQAFPKSQLFVPHPTRGRPVRECTLFRRSWGPAGIGDKDRHL